MNDINTSIMDLLDLRQFAQDSELEGCSYIDIVTMNLWTKCLIEKNFGNPYTSRVWMPNIPKYSNAASIPNFERIKTQDVYQKFENIKRLLELDGFSKYIKNARKLNKDSDEIEIIIDLETHKEKQFFFLRSFKNKNIFKPFQLLKVYYNPEVNEVLGLTLEKFSQAAIKIEKARV